MRWVKGILGSGITVREVGGNAALGPWVQSEIGYSHTYSGALISTVWMTAYGYIFGMVFALIYNSFTKK